MVDDPNSILLDLANPHLISKHEHVWPLVEELGYTASLKGARKIVAEANA
jgi:hypothetical protein